MKSEISIVQSFSVASLEDVHWLEKMPQNLDVDDSTERGIERGEALNMF